MIIYDYEVCIGCRDCFLVCPRGVWTIDETKRKAQIGNHKKCIDCTACEFQCPVRAIRIERRIIPKAPIIRGK
ncbi:MAG: ferredoxin family protein [Candidatus Thorarchaeota archaeon]